MPIQNGMAMSGSNCAKQFLDKEVDLLWNFVNVWKILGLDLLAQYGAWMFPIRYTNLHMPTRIKIYTLYMEITICSITCEFSFGRTNNQGYQIPWISQQTDC